MKKLLLLTLLISMTFILTACGKEGYIGTWEHTDGSYKYTMIIEENGNWTITRGDIKREGKYEIIKKDGRTILKLIYSGYIGNGYTEYENGKMCACKKDNCEIPIDDDKCVYTFDKVANDSNIFKK